MIEKSDIITMAEHLLYGEVLKNMNHRLCFVCAGKQKHKISKERQAIHHLNKLRNVLDDVLMKNNMHESYHSLSNVYYGATK